MITSKERAALRAQANPLEDTLIVGKSGISQTLLDEAVILLDSHELVKGRVLETAGLTAREASDMLCEALGAEGIVCVGTKFVIWRKSEKLAQEKKKADEKYKKGLAAYIRKTNPNVKKSKSLKMAGYFIAKGKKYNLDPKVLMAIAKNESTFYTNAKSPYGYKGLMQTSDALARKYGYKPSSLYKAEVSIEVGARYLRAMKNKFKTYTKALSAYAYGEGTVMSGNYSKSIAKKLLRTRKDITKYLERNNYI